MVENRNGLLMLEFQGSSFREFWEKIIEICKREADATKSYNGIIIKGDKENE